MTHGIHHFAHVSSTYIYFNVRFACACAIPDPAGPSVVVTGGYNSTVSRYNRNGWVEDLAKLTVGRYTHGCAGLMRDGELVSRYL